mmetsp:Transcript_40620/g.39223  ORF Transcript_40620/g.39223 Transcript_40620/m.39223 type:complete len:99 (-) Transcript_40620:705-1001(-)
MGGRGFTVQLNEGVGKNNEIDLVPENPFYCKIPIESRVAPVHIKFDYGYMQGENIYSKDVTAYLSMIATEPDEGNSQYKKTKPETIIFGGKQAGKRFT